MADSSRASTPFGFYKRLQGKLDYEPRSGGANQEARETPIGLDHRPRVRFGAADDPRVEWPHPWETCWRPPLCGEDNNI